MPGNDDHEAALREFTSQFDGLVAVVDGSPECYVATGQGSMRYLADDLPLSGVMAVTTSHLVRRQGLARRLAAQALAREAAAGVAVSGLGMFDQGYYNRLGFGTGPYEHWHSIDPASLRIPGSPRVPKRITTDDVAAVHASRLSRTLGHGSVNFAAEAATRSEMMWSDKGFGLGYADGPNGEITHHMWFSAKSMEFGPLQMWWMAYQTPAQLLELLGLLVHLGDNVQLVKMREPAGIQLQDFIDRPFRKRRMTEKSSYENRIAATAYWQMRICDLETCLAGTHLDGSPVRFNLMLTDPVEELLGDDDPWRGVGGEYVVTLGPESEATAGGDPGLPTLTAGVGAFSRMWLGVRPASGLAVTDDLEGSDDLLAALDDVLRIPEPRPDWDF